MFALSDDGAKLAAAFTAEMLKRVEHCYHKASDCDADDNEEWLHHYMLGKVAEKTDRPPAIYLEHYKQAAEYLHDYRAKYPRKIPYYTPPHLAVEALEVHFRLHVCVIKILMRGADNMDELPYELLEEYVTEAAQAPFTLCVEKKTRRNTDRSEPEDTDYSAIPQGAPPDSSTPKRKSKLSLPDHNYSKHKFSSESSEQSSQESLDVSHDSQPLTPGRPIASPPIITHSLHFPITERRRHWSGSEAAISRIPPSDSKSMPGIFPTTEKAGSTCTTTAPPGEQSQKSGGFSTSFSMESILKKDVATPSTPHEAQPTTQNTDVRQCDTGGVKRTDKDSHSQDSQPRTTPDSQSKDAEICNTGPEKSVVEATITEMDCEAQAMPTLTADIVQQQNSLQPLTVQVDDKLTLPDPMEVDQPPMLSPIEEALASFERERLKMESEELDPKPDSVAPPGECSDDHKHDQPGDKTKTVRVEKDEDAHKDESNKKQTEEGPKEGIADDEDTLPKLSRESEDSTMVGSQEKQAEVNMEMAEAPVLEPVDCGLEKSGEKQPESEESKKKTEEEKEKKESEPPLIRYKKLMDGCIAALRLCLSRFPQHYKSLYRLAYIYYHSPHYRDLQVSCDMLLSNPQWQQLSHMPCPGLFHDRKNTNLFQGLWKIPIEEIDRSGSFATHLAKPLLLLFDVLRDRKDVTTLYHIHMQLAKTPDLGKKYLREVDRDYLSQLAYERCLDALQFQITGWESTQDRQVTERFMLQTYRIWQHGCRKTYTARVNRLLGLAYSTCCKQQVDPHLPLVEQATRYCQQLQTARAAQASSLGGSTPGSMHSQPHRPSLDGATWQRQTSTGSAPTTPMLESYPILKRVEPLSVTSSGQTAVPKLQTTLSTGFMPKLDIETAFPLLESSQVDTTTSTTTPTTKTSPQPPVLSPSIAAPGKREERADRMDRAFGGKPSWESLDSSLALLANIASVVSEGSGAKLTSPGRMISTPQIAKVTKVSEASTSSSAGKLAGSIHHHAHVKLTYGSRIQGTQSWTQSVGSQGSSRQQTVHQQQHAPTVQTSSSVTMTYPLKSTTVQIAASSSSVPSSGKTLQNPTIVPGIRPLPGTDPTRYGATSSVARTTATMATASLATRPSLLPSNITRGRRSPSSSDDSDCIIILSSQESDDE